MVAAIRTAINATVRVGKTYLATAVRTSRSAFVLEFLQPPRKRSEGHHDKSKDAQCAPHTNAELDSNERQNQDE